MRCNDARPGRDATNPTRGAVVVVVVVVVFVVVPLGMSPERANW